MGSLCSVFFFFHSFLINDNASKHRLDALCAASVPSLYDSWAS